MSARAWILLGLVHLPILAADRCAPHQPEVQHRDHASLGPSLTFPLGTDDVGRDVSSRVLHGARLSLAAAGLATAIALTAALVIGGAAGYAGRAADAVLTVATEAVMAVPWMFLLLAVRSALPLDLSPERTFLLVSCLVGCIGWGASARLIRSVVRQARTEDYVLAARAAGASAARTFRAHVLPASASVVAAQALVLFPQFVMAEVTLSFLGLGISEPTASLGTLLGELRSSSAFGGQAWRFAPAAVLVLLLAGYRGVARLAEHRRRTSTSSP